MNLVFGAAGLLAGIGLGLLSALVWRAGMVAALSTARHAATHDPLTGLLNRAGWHAAAPALLDRAADAGQRVAVLVVDLDGFKAVNDTHGHAAGDGVLWAVGRRLSSVVADRGVVARLGGDEYAALVTCPAGDPHTWVAGLAARIRAAVPAPVGIPTAILSVGASVGVTVLPSGTRRDVDLSAALSTADVAMYRDKDRTPEVTR